jgi:glycerophosphoryl diester phosphodiesterase
VGAWYASAWVRRIPAEGPALAIAHRGAPETSGAPENTLEAFRAALEAGADWLEFDVRATRDGVLVVIHDETVDRTTNGVGLVSELTLEELQTLDVDGGARVPTVAQVVALAASAGVPVLPEVKVGHSDPTVASRLVELLRSAGYLERSVIQSSDAETLEQLHRLGPDVATCWITGLWQLDVSAPPADADNLCPMGEMVLLNPDMIRQGHADGRQVLPWWSRLESGPAEAVLEAFGADGLIVDDVRPIVDR